MTDPLAHDPLATDNPEQPGGPEASGNPPPPMSEDELPEVGDDEAAAHAEELGDEVAQPGEHPYDPDGDPDGEPKNLVGSAGGPAEASGTLSTNAEEPWAAGPKFSG